MSDKDGVPADFLKVRSDLIGTRIGVYQVTSLLGAGGMGQVYRARDTKLGRDVAIKVLPPEFVADRERLSRFEREARVLASLNHPHIAAIYGVEECSGTPALILELVEGETLADRLQTGPLRTSDALNYARQIADALDAAHERGIIHRDLKPANITITPGGAVKVLDFGLAKTSEPVGRDSSRALHETRSGVILGTAAYMSPEQARGQAVDKRTDIWAFGCVLYEALTGKPAFPGATLSDIVAAILEHQPEWTALPDTTPATVRRLMVRCLEKDPKARLRDIGDVIAELDEERSPPAALHDTPYSFRRVALFAAAMAISGALVGVAVWSWTPSSSRQVTRFTYHLPESQRITNGGRQIVAISPSGGHIVYAANLGLYRKAMNAVESTEIKGSTSKNGVVNAVFSPDGEFVAYWEHTGSGGGDGVLRKIHVGGGAPITLCLASIPYGMTWDESGILFGQSDSTIRRVSSEGGTPEVIVRVDKDQIAHSPQLLPDRRSVIYTLARRVAGGGVVGTWDDSQIVAHILGSGERKVLIARGSAARYLSTGHILYAIGETVFAVRFDAQTVQTVGASVPVIERVARSFDQSTGTAQFSVSDNGSLVYLSSSIDGSTSGHALPAISRTIVWVDRNGREERVPAPSRNYLYPRLSPDGTRVALDVRGAADETPRREIWIWEFARSILTKITVNSQTDKHPIWTPDGRHLVFTSERSGSEELFRVAADGAAEPEPLRIEGRQSKNALDPLAFSPDGTRLIFREIDPKTRFDLHMLTRDSSSTTWRARVLIRSPHSENNAAISPDGRWMAYESDESGQYEIYVRPFPNIEDGRRQISQGGGTRPLWSRAGTELFYMTGESAPDVPIAVMSTTVEARSTTTFGTPRALFEGLYFAPRPTAGGPTGRTYDVAPDGNRFLIIKSVGGFVQRPPIVVVLNWYEELKQKMPVGRDE